MLSAATLGFFIGMRHALDPDHLVAIAVLNSERLSTGAAARQGFAWGIGHALTVLVVGAIAVALGLQLPPEVAHLMEVFVGLLLIALGIDLIRRLLLRKPLPAQAAPADSTGFPQRALSIGLVHGLAGSSAITLIALGSITSPALAILFLVLFGAGSIAGMTLLSAALAAPLAVASTRASWVTQTTRVVASCASIAVGALLIQQALMSS